MHHYSNKEKTRKSTQKKQLLVTTNPRFPLTLSSIIKIMLLTYERVWSELHSDFESPYQRGRNG